MVKACAATSAEAGLDRTALGHGVPAPGRRRLTALVDTVTTVGVTGKVPAPVDVLAMGRLTSSGWSASSCPPRSRSPRRRRRRPGPAAQRPRGRRGGQPAGDGARGIPTPPSSRLSTDSSASSTAAAISVRNAASTACAAAGCRRATVSSPAPAAPAAPPHRRTPASPVDEHPHVGRAISARAR